MSMMLRRAAPSDARPSVHTPTSSGPRWRSAAIISGTRSGSAMAPLVDTYPAIPHISGRHADAVLEPVRQRHETAGVVARIDGVAARAACRRGDREPRTRSDDVVRHELVAIGD